MKIAFDTPDVFFKKIWEKIPVNVRVAFFSAIVMGLMAHLYQFTNKLYNYDELHVMPAGYGTGAELGRWFLKIMGDKGAVQFGNYSIPLLYGMVSLLLIAVSAALVTDLFQMQSRVFSAMLGGFMAVFPTVVCTFYFMFTSIFYFIALLFSVLAAWLIVKFPRNILAHMAAVILIACATGTYQAYFPNTVCLLLLTVIMHCAKEEERTWKEILFTALRYLGVLIAGLIGYLVVNKVLLAKWGVTMLSYQGADAMGQLTAGEIFRALKTCYKNFLTLGSAYVCALNPTVYVKKCFIIIMLMFAVGLFAKLFGEKGCIIKKIFMAVGFALIPVGTFLIQVMVPNGWVYTLMVYPVVFVPIFMLVWTDHFTVAFDKKQILKKAMQWVATVVSVVMIGIYIWYANGCYLSQEYTKYHDMAYYEVMVTQIKSLDGYKDEMPLALIGNTITDETDKMGSMMQNTFGMDGKSESHISSYSKVSIMTKLLGFAPDFLGYEEIVELMGTDEVQAMPCYPDDGSIQIVDDVVVVKLSE